MSVVGFMRVCWVNLGMPCGRPFHFGSFGPFVRALGIIGFIRVTLIVSLVSIRARPGAVPVHFGTFMGSLR